MILSPETPVEKNGKVDLEAEKIPPQCGILVEISEIKKNSLNSDNIGSENED